MKMTIAKLIVAAIAIVLVAWIANGIKNQFKAALEKQRQQIELIVPGNAPEETEVV